jgi:hypothetical protein
MNVRPAAHGPVFPYLFRRKEMRSAAGMEALPDLLRASREDESLPFADDHKDTLACDNGRLR